MSDGWGQWLVLPIAASLFAAGFGLGHGFAAAKGRADLLAAKAVWEEERKENAEAYARALSASQERYRKEVERADSVANSYAESKQAHAKEAEALQRRIARVARNGSHTFSPDFVRLYNEAIGLSGDALSEALCSFRPAGSAGASGAPGPGGPDSFTGVNEADLLEHITRYGRRCRGLESQVLGWQALQRSWQ